MLNATVKPLLQFLVLRFIFSTYGIVVVDHQHAAPGPARGDPRRHLRGLPARVGRWSGGLVVGVLGLILETLLGATPPILDRDYKERNGLS